MWNSAMGLVRGGRRWRFAIAGLAGGLLLTAASQPLWAQAVESADPAAGRAKPPPELAALERAIASGQGLEDLGDAMADAGLEVRSMVPALACTSDGPAGPATHIPVQIGGDPGERRSILTLRVGQTTIAGIYVVAGATYERHVTRRTGSSALAVGDVLEERLIDRAGQVAQTLQYRVTRVDHAGGSFRAANIGGAIKNGDIVNSQDGWCWFCNGGSSWWCGFPCFPDFGDDEPTTEGPIAAATR